MGSGQRLLRREGEYYLSQLASNLCTSHTHTPTRQGDQKPTKLKFFCAAERGKRRMGRGRGSGEGVRGNWRKGGEKDTPPNAFISLIMQRKSTREAPRQARSLIPLLLIPPSFHASTLAHLCEQGLGRVGHTSPVCVCVCTCIPCKQDCLGVYSNEASVCQRRGE